MGYPLVETRITGHRRRHAHPVRRFGIKIFDVIMLRVDRVIIQWPLSGTVYDGFGSKG